ncbi:MAG: FAD-dependent oxidoreductase, partial [Actinomycetota bacterium]|nr:FAD-dependent oxidoreductase [Actinomycetota bacterium]
MKHTPANSDDVARAVDEARSGGLRVAVVSTGHGLRPLGGLSGSLMLDVSGLDSVDIDTERNLARIGGGVKWNGLLEDCSPLGLTGPFGSAGGVGVTGYSLGGGIGPLGRHLGLGSTAVRAVELVTAEGELIRTDGTSDPELLWALKGGGGGLGIVTSLELELTPLPTMTGGMLVWPMARASEVAHAWA